MKNTQETIDEICKKRGLPNFKKGMRCRVNGRSGAVVGGNKLGNLSVIFDGEKTIESCHPNSKMEIFYNDGLIAYSPLSDQNQAKKEQSCVKIRPLHDRVVIRRIDEEKTTKSGLIIPNAAAEKPSEGIIVATGRCVDKADIKNGDKVLFAKFSGTEIKMDNENMLITSEKEILAVIENDE